MRLSLHHFILVLMLFGACPVSATPSSTYWTPCTIGIQPAGVTHIGVDSCFEFGSNRPDRTDEFVTDVGPEWGAQWGRVGIEYGFDILSSPVTTPFFFNTKIGYRENTISKNAPAV